MPALKELLEAAGGNSLAQQLEAEAMMYDRAATHPQRVAAKQAKVAEMVQRQARRSPGRGAAGPTRMRPTGLHGSVAGGATQVRELVGCDGALHLVRLAEVDLFPFDEPLR